MHVNNLTKNYLKHHISGYVSKDQKTENLDKHTRLDLGENLLGCSHKTLSCLKKIKQSDLNYYTDPSGSKIKKTISNLYKIKQSNIILSNSSDEIIQYLPKIILNPKEKALVITPTFFRFIESTLSAGGKLIYQPLAEKKNYEHSQESIENIIKKINKHHIKLVWLCNPNNPSGTILNLSQIEQIVKNSKAFVVLDEAFYEFYDLENKNSGLKLIHKYQNLIVLRTLSKAYGLAGLRLGYALAHEKTAKTIEKCRNTLLMTSAVVQKIAISALKDQSWLKKTVTQTKKLQKEVITNLKKQENLHLIASSKTNVYLLKHKTKDIYKELKKRGILTADFRNAKGIEGKKYVRITVGNKKSNQKLLIALKKI